MDCSIRSVNDPDRRHRFARSADGPDHRAMELSFAEEIEQLRLGDGQVFHGEGILAVTKALLQSGVSYIGGYQGSPVSNLLDVMVQARELVAELGVHVEPCTNEASAAAMLGASIMYPVRGAVTWKSIVGTNVAADALSNLSSPGVMGGVLIVVGEDYGEGASVIQERTHAYALKSTMALLDPRPDLPSITQLTQAAFELSEASNLPVMMSLRIRACHLRGSFVARNNKPGRWSTRERLAEPASFLYDRLSHPPVTFQHEKRKVADRLPAARRFIVERRINEQLGGRHTQLGLIVQGGLTSNLIRALQHLQLADDDGAPHLPVLILNAVYPLVPEQITGFCAGKAAVLVLEEGAPKYIEQEVATHLLRAGSTTRLHGEDLLKEPGELGTEAMLRGLKSFVEQHQVGHVDPTSQHALATIDQARQRAAQALVEHTPPRPPTFCIGCPERPVFSALKQVREQIGATHISTDIGCHAFATFAPFSMGNSILGYGMSMASAAAVAPLSSRRPLAIMGDGGFWHNGLLSGVASNLMNGGDAVLLIMKNGYTSATGTQEVISSPDENLKRSAGAASATHTETTIEDTLRGMGVKWMKTVHTYRVAQMKTALTEAFTTPAPGLKVIVAEGECQLERQRRIRPQVAAALKAGERVVRTRFGVDEDVCTGDHACVRLSACPSLTITDARDPLKLDPVAYVTPDCVGCGLCGENAHAATLCPSFFKVEVIQNPGWRDRWADRWRRAVLRWFGGRGPADVPADAPAVEALT
jgi:indolepyruvate ferredoxin oxidoreductase, alpha subunit